MKLSRTPGFLLMVCFFLFCTTIPARNEEKDITPSSEENGAAISILESKSLEKRKEWLKNNTDHREYFIVLKDTISLFTKVDEAISFIKGHIPNLRTDSQRFYILRTLGEHEKLSGNFESAQRHFQLASSFDKGLPGYKALFSSAYLLFQMGELDRCEEQIKIILLDKNQLDSKTIKQTWFFYTRLLIEKKNFPEAKRICDMMYKEYKNDLSSKDAYMLYTLAIKLELSGITQKAAEILRKNYPDSPEYSLVYGGPVDKIPWPRYYLGTEETRTEKSEDSKEEETVTESNLDKEEKKDLPKEMVLIQTGSYTYIKNAQSMVQELKRKGFIAVIKEKMIENTKYYTVVVPNIPMEKSQEFLITLKDQGIEGFLIY